MLNKWQEYGMLGGRPRTRETVIVDDIEMSVKREKRGKRWYKYGIWTDWENKPRKTYLGPVEESEQES